MYDIVLIGATGFTAKLIIRYLQAHPNRKSFTFAVTARSKSKLEKLVNAFNLGDDVGLIELDVSKEEEVVNAVTQARVVISAVGPFWVWGTPIVRACARLGKHYVDITAETVWLQHIIDQYDYSAYKSGAIIIPSCGQESVPSDLIVYLAYKKLREVAGPSVQLGHSMSLSYGGSVASGGTARTSLAMSELIPRNAFMSSLEPYSISPVTKPLPKDYKIYHKLPYVSPPLYGSFHPLTRPNVAIVQRTWGLFQNQKNAQTAYGEDFTYEEHAIMPSAYKAFIWSIILFTTTLLIFTAAPVRWLIRQLIPDVGGGPSEEVVQNTRTKIINVTSTSPKAGLPQKHVKTSIRCKGDGYLVSSITAAESALALLDPSNVSPLARNGGIFTPASALGDVLSKRLEESGRFEIVSEEIVDV